MLICQLRIPSDRIHTLLKRLCVGVFLPPFNASYLVINGGTNVPAIGGGSWSGRGGGWSGRGGNWGWWGLNCNLQRCRKEYVVREALKKLCIISDDVAWVTAKDVVNNSATRTIVISAGLWGWRLSAFAI